MHPWAFIALGANLGNAVKTITDAVQHLERLSDAPLLKSSLWESDPVDCPPGSPKFVNAVIGIAPRIGETPETLLAKFQELETVFGRKPKTIMNEPRPLDLDLIVFGDEMRVGPSLILPHPRATQRRFVLQPLAEIAPDLLLPGQTQSVRQLLAALPSEPKLILVQGN
jgi:2-amino-4-hydroxy-6-hydroxymethyldihydropteridine diphosphokinase